MVPAGDFGEGLGGGRVNTIVDLQLLEERVAKFVKRVAFVRTV